MQRAVCVVCCACCRGSIREAVVVGALFVIGDMFQRAPGLETEGIFRIPGNTLHVENLKKYYNGGMLGASRRALESHEWLWWCSLLVQRDHIVWSSVRMYMRLRACLSYICESCQIRC